MDAARRPRRLCQDRSRPDRLLVRQGNHPAHSSHVRDRGRVFRVLAELRPADGTLKSLRVILEDGDERQELYASGQATDPFAALEWIGDLDRDGRPDLLLSVRYHYSTVSHRLYLSSFAAGKELTRHVGSIEVSLD